MKATIDRLSFAARGALQWRLLLLWGAWLLIPTAIAAVPVAQLLSAHLDYSVHAARFAESLDMLAITDLKSLAGLPPTGFVNAALLAMIVTLLISPLLSGMAISAARAEGLPGFRDLTAGGLREYPRLLRMLLWAALPLLAAAAIGGTLLDMSAGMGGPARALAVLCALLLLMLAHASVDAGRAVLALDRRRTSAVLGWWSGCKLLKRRPVATLGLYAAISAAGLLVAALLAWARLHVPSLGFAGLLGAFVLTQLIVMVVAWMKIARLFALIGVAG